MPDEIVEEKLSKMKFFWKAHFISTKIQRNIKSIDTIRYYFGKYIINSLELNKGVMKKTTSDSDEDV